jgi:CHAT domain-containing protein/tetratricopeptide (TPR) repeat protein
MTSQRASSSSSGQRARTSAYRAAVVLLWLSLLTGSRLGPPTLGFAAGAHHTVQESALRLAAGRPVVGALSTGETHSYTMTLAADEFVSISVEQRGVDVVATLVGPDARKRTDANNAKGGQGVEALTIIADTAGDYRLDVRAAEQNAPRGSFEVRLVATRAPTPEDRTMDEARRLFDTARDLRQQGQFDEALLPAERAVALREQTIGPDHTLVADALHLLAVIYDDKHEYAKAEAPNLRALAIREKALGPDHPAVARSLFNLAWLTKVKQNYAEAESLYRRALAIQERALGPGHSEVATTLNDLAVLYNQTGKYDESIQVNARVLAIREKALGPEDPGVAKALNNLARAYENKGDYEKARSLLERAVAVWEKALGPNHADVAFALDGLAKIFSATGDYAAAEPLFLRALAIRETALGPDHTEVATTLNNLAVVYRQKGDYATAERLLLRDLAITEKRLGRDHAFVGPTLTNLAATHQAQGAYDTAEPLLRRALGIYEKAHGPSHLNIALTLNRLAQLDVQRGSRAPLEAESMFRRALAILEKAIGPEHPAVATSFIGLASIATARGDRAQAAGYYQRALAVQEKTLGPDHPDQAQTLESLAALHRMDGRTGEAVTLLARAHDIRERSLAHNLPLGSERQKIGYLRLFAEDTDRALSLHAQAAPDDTAALRLAFSTLLRRKGRALDATRDNVGLLRINAAPQDRALLDQLSRARSQLSAVTLRGPGGTDRTYRALVTRLQEKVEQLETAVGARSSAFQAQSAPIMLEAVQAAIPDGATLVEFALYHPSTETPQRHSAPHYSAYTLTARGAANWVDLGGAAAIDATIEAWRAALRDPGRADTSHLARTLDAKVMQPVRRVLGETRHLLVSPDGPLNMIPFAALVDEQNRYLLERYTITYLTSGRDLLRLQVPRESRSRPLIVAAPIFGEPALVAAGREKPARVDDSQVFFGPLPGVREEARALQQMLPDATMLVGERATEAAVRSAAAPRLLHIATHGFFLSDRDGRAIDRTGRAAPGARIGRWAAWAENPLLRSGLAMAGANQGRSGEDDGVLTALEAAGLDLWGTKLVVLSACDTGVGDVTRGDGVYGLRRALVLAGAETQLMSLWPVSDRSTRDLMIGYYKQVTQGEGRGEALRRAQIGMLRASRHRHPYYWAGFIQSGEWANLDGKR